ncbi:MAG: NAD(P)-dependent oxidoreductase [Proteobacteria bacterium]|nr:NAD(P)-dependent oxidoreductase [Pseudomonadota bacterium]
MTILVTGSAGHLGEALMRSLRATGQAALGIDLKPSLFTDSVGSICDRGFVGRSMHGVRAVLHAATLHKPHIATHTQQDFLDTNVTGTLVLLEAALAAGVRAFVFTSTTSAFGSALTPSPGEPAAWVTEDVVPIPKNIYGVSKLAGEDLCELAFRTRRLPVIILRTSRFFPEADDDAKIRAKYEVANVQANELLYRRVDLEDVVSAHFLAVGKAEEIGFGRYIISASTPFAPSDLAELRRNAPAVVYRMYPDCEALFTARSWAIFPNLDRVYVNDLARAKLDWKPKYDFAHMLACLRTSTDFRSQLARDVGAKGYHSITFENEPYPIA